MHALNGSERGWGERGMGEGLDWGKELMSRNKRRQCCRIKMLGKVTDVDALHKRIWLRTSVSSLPSPLLLFLFPFTLCHFLLQPFLCQHYFTVHNLIYSSLCLRLLYLSHVWVHHYVRLFSDAIVTESIAPLLPYFKPYLWQYVTSDTLDLEVTAVYNHVAFKE